uniref:Uncharacterized protein n=1 Tax=Oryza brachyantha TaxID=4533 RepID=J3MBF5_ORYBR
MESECWRSDDAIHWKKEVNAKIHFCPYTQVPHADGDEVPCAWETWTCRYRTFLTLGCGSING